MTTVMWLLVPLCALVAGFFILIRVVVETLRHTQVTP